jgi:3-oxoacyl-[acyl-carrier-protein] synthase III
MISYIDYFVPQARLRVDRIFECLELEGQIPANFDTKEDGVGFFSGLLNLSSVSDGGSMSESEMLEPLLSKFFNTSSVKPEEVELLILVDDQMDRGCRPANFAHYLQHSYKLKKANVLVFSGNHCANLEHIVVYAESMLKAGVVKNILAVAVNKIVKVGDRIVGNYAVMGDGAGLIYFENDSENGIELRGQYLFTNGLLYESTAMDTDNSLLLMKNYMLCLSGLLKKNSIKPNTVKNVIVQNANPLLISQCLLSVGFKSEQIYSDQFASYGHLDCIDFLVNLRSLATSSLKSGHNIVSFGLGPAGSYICLYLQVK